MKNLLVAINAKYIHSNLGVRTIQKYLQANTNYSLEVKEYTINQHLDYILSDIYLQNPDILGFSCYIWNFEYIKTLSCEIKKILPSVKIIWGGPEVSYKSENYLNGFTDYIICGEGEEKFTELITKLEQGEIIGQRIIFGSPVDMNAVPFVYDDLSLFKNKIIYYESSRGCPFSCQYCMSSIEKRVHYLSLERTLSELSYFLDNKVRQVKFIDRTFNCNKKRTLQIWKHLINNDNGVTNFHFEIAAEMLDDECIDMLSKVRKGFFQLEIGVQSTNVKTLEAVKRYTNIKSVFVIVSKLLNMKNIHIHLDLIAGLPYEDIKIFENSFNEVYSYRPHQLQLGFLKVLKGAGVYENAEEFGLLYTEKPPYEVLQTKWLSYKDIIKLKIVEDMVERYYNSNRYKLMCEYLSSMYDSEYQFFYELGYYYVSNSYNVATVSEMDSYTVLYDFAKSNQKSFKNIEIDKIISYSRFDIYSHKKAKKIPNWLNEDYNIKYKYLIREFYQNEKFRAKYLNGYEKFDSKQLANITHLEIFNINPITNANELTAILFDYRDCDILGNAKTTNVTDCVFTKDFNE